MACPPSRKQRKTGDMSRSPSRSSPRLRVPVCVLRRHTRHGFDDDCGGDAEDGRKPGDDVTPWLLALPKSANRAVRDDAVGRELPVGGQEPKAFDVSRGNLAVRASLTRL